MIRAPIVLAAPLVLAAALGGCGQKGPLRIPEPATAASAAP
jgi:predicted small lipoprotein YifL